MADSKPPDQWATATIELSVSGEPVRVAATVPTGPARPQQLLPVFQSFAEIMVNLAVKRVTAAGQMISCQAGCGACCRQLVPISEIEARRLAEMVNQLPAERQTTIRARFAAARQRLEATGLWAKLFHPAQFSDDELRPTGLEYFQLGIACPFLEAESCSIYADRPISCREYLVTSPPENCAQPTAETVHCVPLAGKVSSAVNRLEEDPSGRFVRWVPLVTALDWVASHPYEGPLRPGPVILQEFLEKLLRQPLAVEPATGPSDSAAT